MKNQINLAIQVLPKSNTRELYDIVDEAIAIISSSGLKYQVCPFETVIEGPYDQVMSVVEKVNKECLEKGASELLVNIKMQIRKDENVTIDEKMVKYS